MLSNSEGGAKAGSLLWLGSASKVKLFRGRCLSNGIIIFPGCRLSFFSNLWRARSFADTAGGDRFVRDRLSPAAASMGTASWVVELSYSIRSDDADGSLPTDGVATSDCRLIKLGSVSLETFSAT